MPIAERYLLLSIGLLTFEPQVVLWTITVAVVIALAWTQGGRTVKAILGSDGFRPEPGLSPTHWGELDHELDLGPIARGAGRLARLPGSPIVWVVAGALLVGCCALVLVNGALAAWLALVLVVVGTVLVGCGARPPLQHPLGWQVPALLWAAEAALVLALVDPLPEAAEWVGYAYLAAVAWHRYDVSYRLRDTGRPAAAWVTAATLGVDGRWLVLALVAVFEGPVQPILAWGALALFAVYAAESASGWRAWARAQGVQASGGADHESAVVA
jgi:hypothetical protein